MDGRIEKLAQALDGNDFAKEALRSFPDSKMLAILAVAYEIHQLWCNAQRDHAEVIADAAAQFMLNPDGEALEKLRQLSLEWAARRQ